MYGVMYGVMYGTIYGEEIPIYGRDGFDLANDGRVSEKLCDNRRNEELDRKIKGQKNDWRPVEPSRRLHSTGARIDEITCAPSQKTAKSAWWLAQARPDRWGRTAYFDRHDATTGRKFEQEITQITEGDNKD